MGVKPFIFMSARSPLLPEKSKEGQDANNDKETAPLEFYL